MDIRLAVPEDDRLAISHVYEESWKYAYRGMIPDAFLDGMPKGRWAERIDTPGWHSLLLLDGGRIAGTSTYCASRFPERAGWGEIASIYLLPEYMCKGYGGALLRAALDGLAAMGLGRVFLRVLEENARARRFYERMGFRASGIVLTDEIGGRTVRELEYIYDGMEGTEK